MIIEKDEDETHLYYEKAFLLYKCGREEESLDMYAVTVCDVRVAVETIHFHSTEKDERERRERYLMSRLKGNQKLLLNFVSLFETVGASSLCVHTM
jgi:hypothetical protein